MTHSIIIETENQRDAELIKGLANRLGLPVVERHTGKATEKQKAIFKKLFGRWEGEESAEELAASIRAARHDSPRDIEL